ncbi:MULTISPECIES: aldo/keto reductase [Acidianus]|uniref:Aldo/keto reductase n=1 Tax=Candidatus Acidianus copahuensis TaxID=1160895 RepID=A0A031LQS3_9CREN|nr:MULTISPECIES: aldo/keto reductase [Acidianus]EZQ06769.1 aldo/keto reductase [Candidatus Acidianus copahuensis]
METLCGKKIFPIGLGTWGIGGGYWERNDTNDLNDLSSLTYAITKGINVIDTAEMYGAGHAEELVGKVIKDREKIVIITKVWPNHLKYEQVIEAAKNSYARLGTYIDLYLIHWPNNVVPLKETIEAMDYLVDQGIVKCIGVSNFSRKLTEEAISYSRHRIIANEIEYNVMNKNVEKDIDFYRDNDIAIIAYKPLSGSIQNKVLAEIGRKYGKTSVQVALNYLMRNSIPIPKATKREHIDEIVGAYGWSLDIEDISTIKEL